MRERRSTTRARSPGDRRYGNRRRRSLSHFGGRTLQAGDPERARELAYAMDTGNDPGRALTHGFHAYPARMHPLTAARVIAAGLGDVCHGRVGRERGDGLAEPHRWHGSGTPGAGETRPIVVDPFCGSGSVAVEAVRAGARFVGGDISAIGLEIAWVRTRFWTPKRCAQIERRAGLVSSRARQLAREDRPRPKWVIAESSWYDTAALRDVWALRDTVDAEPDPELRRVLRMVLSSIVVKVSRQVSDATTLRDRRHQPVRPGIALRLFERRAHELAEQLNALRTDLVARRVEPCEPRLLQADARTTKLVEPHSASLVLTSPPYPGTYDYLLHHARRYAVLGEDASFAGRHEIGSRRQWARADPAAVNQYEEDLAAAMLRMKEAVGPGAAIVVLLGDGVAGRRIIRADELTRRTASRVGLAVVATASQRRPNWLGDKLGPPRMEHLIELRLP